MLMIQKAKAKRKLGQGSLPPPNMTEMKDMEVPKKF